MRQLTSTSGVPVPNKSAETVQSVHGDVVTYFLSQSELKAKRDEWDKQKKRHYRAMEVRA